MYWSIVPSRRTLGLGAIEGRFRNFAAVEKRITRHKKHETDRRAVQ